MLYIKNVRLSINATMTLVESGDFIAKRGELTALIGRSGVGKTTFLNRLIFKQGSLHFDNYKIDGKNIQSSKDLMSHVTYLQQENKFFNDMTMEANLKVHQAILNDESKIDLEKSNVKLSKKYPKHLSGGEINRYEFEKLKLGHPKLILLDETFSSLDQENKLNYIQYLKEKVKQEDCYAILIVHDEGLLPYCDSIYKIEDKRMVNIKQSTFVDKDEILEKKQPSHKLPLLFYFHKLRGNKWNWLFIFILISALTSCFLVSLRMVTWVDRFYQESISLLDPNELLVQRVTREDTGEIVKIDVLDWSFALEEKQISELKALPMMESIYTRYQLYTNEGVIYANQRNLDDYCSRLLSDQGIYISSSMFNKLNVNGNKVVWVIKIPVAQINHMSEDKDTLQYREVKYVENKIEVPIRGILDEAFYNLGSSDFAYMDSEDVERIIKESQSNYRLNEQETYYQPNLFVIHLNNPKDIQKFSESLFKIDQQLVVTSNHQMLSNIRDLKADYNRTLGMRVISITGALMTLTFLTIYFVRRKANKRENDVFKSYGLDKKSINKIIGVKIFMNSLLNGVLSCVVSLYVINELISQRVLTPTQTIPLNYFAIIIICFVFSFTSHSLIRE